MGPRTLCTVHDVWQLRHDGRHKAARCQLAVTDDVIELLIDSGDGTHARWGYHTQEAALRGADTLRRQMIGQGWEMAEA